MLNSPLRSFEHKNFFSINNRDDGQVIPDFYATNIENWLIRDVGSLEMREGITARGVSPSQTNLGSGVLYRANGVKHLVRVINGSGNTSKFQYSEDGSTWTDITSGGSRSSGAKWVFVQANNLLYGVNGVDTPIKYDTSTITTVAAIPIGSSIEWWKNRLWVFGVVSVPDRLYYSNANDPETYGGTDFININLGDNSGGVGLKGTAGATGRLYCGKQRSVWFVTGNTSADFALNPLTYEHGVASHESILQVRNEVWAVDQEGNIRGLYRTSQDNPFSALKSRDIQATIAGLNRVSIANASAVFHNNYALFFIPNGVDSYNSLVLVWDTLANRGRGGWIKFTNWNISRATVFSTTQPKLFLHDSRTNNGQTYEWTGTADNGSAILAKYETKIYDHGYPDREKKWKFAWQSAFAASGSYLRFYSSIDRYYYTLLKNISLSGGSGALWGSATWGIDSWAAEGSVRERINYTDGGGDNTGFTQQIKIEAESSTEQIKVRMFTSHYIIRGLR
jgi:hypothetical protein